MRAAELAQKLDARRTGPGVWTTKCPSHNDEKPSLSIGEGHGDKVLLKCFAGCSVENIVTALGLTMADLFPATSNGDGAVPRPALVLDWAGCVRAFGDNDLISFAGRRGYSITFCQWLRQQKLIGLHEGNIAFPVHDAKGYIVGAHVRPKDGRDWFYFPKGVKVRPLVIGELRPGDVIHVFESQFDAFAFMDLSGERSGIVVTRGAQNGALATSVIPKDATVYLWPQNDVSGEKLTKDICASAKTTVKACRVPPEHKDANEWLLAGPTAEDLREAIAGAEVLREQERSWDDALSGSAVTSSQLRSLKLTPRKKLLGDWFCEGDQGFIFAFRGTGKTWFAIAIAQAISSGSGKLGDWQVHEPVKVLFVDTEMPADLMRDRIAGLQANDNLLVLNHDVLFERTGKVLNIASPEIQEALTKLCVKSGVKVLIIDNLSTGATGLKENESDSWERMLPWLLDLRRRKIAVVLVHHAGRSGEMRGTSRREDSVFWIIALDDMKKNADDKRGARFISRFSKCSRNSQEEQPAYEWHFVTEADGRITTAHKIAQSLDVFREVIADGVTDCQQIASEMMVSPATVSRMAKRAIDQGWLKKRGRHYELQIDTGKEAEE
jgi:AAA domain/Toprim-like